MADYKNLKSVSSIIINNFLFPEASFIFNAFDTG